MLVVAAAAVVVVVATLLLAGRSGKRGNDARPGAAAVNDDPWAASTRDPASEAARMARAQGKTGWLRARPAGPPVKVRGVVRLAPGGTPVAGAEVAFLNETGENTTVTDGKGSYEITVASQIAWNVHARTDTAVGYPEKFLPVGDAPEHDLEIHPTATVKGRVIDMRGAAVPEAEVSLFVDASGRTLLESALPLSTVADAGGRFELPALPGAVLVKGASGMRQGVGVLATLAPGEVGEVEIRLLDPIAVRGRVVDGKGEGIGGAKVLAAATIHPGGPTEKAQLDTRPDGTFELAMPAGWLRLEARRLGEISPAIAQWVGSGEQRDDIVLTLAPPSSLRGKVVTTAGVPVSGAKVRLVANAVYDTTTATNGTFDVQAIAGQAYLVKIRHTDGMLDRQVAAWNGEEVFVMKPFGGLRVLAEGARGEVTVTLDSFVPDGEAAPRPPAQTQFRSSASPVSIANLEPGRYDLTVSAGTAGSVRVARVAVAEGAVRDVKVSLAAPVAVRGTVKSGNQPVSGARVAIGARSAFSDSKGKWVVTAVPAGPVSVIVTKTGFGTAWAGGLAAEDADPIAVDMRPASDAAGMVEGIGVVLAPAASGAVVTTVLPGSPAEGKLVTGDVIEGVAGEDVTAAPIDEIVARLRGPSGSSVSIELRRGDDEKTVDVVRKRLVVPAGTPVTGIAAVFPRPVPRRA